MDLISWHTELFRSLISQYTVVTSRKECFIARLRLEWVIAIHQHHLGSILTRRNSVETLYRQKKLLKWLYTIYRKEHSHLMNIVQVILRIIAEVEMICGCVQISYNIQNNTLNVNFTIKFLLNKNLIHSHCQCNKTLYGYRIIVWNCISTV